MAKHRTHVGGCKRRSLALRCLCPWIWCYDGAGSEHSNFELKLVSPAQPCASSIGHDGEALTRRRPRYTNLVPHQKMQERLVTSWSLTLGIRNPTSISYPNTLHPFSWSNCTQLSLNPFRSDMFRSYMSLGNGGLVAVMCRL